MGALSFASPLVLASLTLLPVIWFLLRATPPSPQQVRFPAFDILLRLGRTPETPHRTPWWILLLRLTITAFVIVGLAGPVLNAPPPPTSDGPMVIVVDNSWAAAPGWKLRRDALQRAGEQSARTKRQIYLFATADAEKAAPQPITGDDLIEVARELQPQPLSPDYAAAAQRIEALSASVRDAEIIWLSDGVEHANTGILVKALRSLGEVSAHLDDKTPTLALFPPRREENLLIFKVANINGASWRGDIVALARGGRELARTDVNLPAGAESIDATINLPLALQNDLAEARLEGISSAGAVQLADARERRALIGFIASGESSIDPLLAGQHYVKKALAPFALFVTDSLENLIASEASVIILDDTGVIRTSDIDQLTAWIEKGGVVVRFAGPTLAEAAEDAAPPLLPVRLRGGGRAFGGALTWETPQPLGPFAADGPFADLTPPKDVFVRQQVLAEPGGDTSNRSWASLSDGTPLVTGETLGAGALVLFHVTATPAWSDLPLSEIFIEMLRRVTFKSAIGPKPHAADAGRRASPFRVLDGYGSLRQPSRDLPSSTLSEIAAGPAPGRPPGLYGAPEAPIALNVVSANDQYQTFRADGVKTFAYAATPPLKFAPGLFLIALLLLIADALIAMRFAGRLPQIAAAAAALFVAAPHPAQSAPLERPITEEEREGALAMRLAYIRTGDPATDRISLAGLRGLSRELARRTSSEPAAPAGIDPEYDDLSVYPFLYWPITPGAAAPTERALANVETFMRFGGLIVFDTRDDERAVNGVDTPEGAALKAILAGIDLPPLTPVQENHVLYRSFYLLSDLPGRLATRPVWVQAGNGPNDSVTPLIIGGRDWAGAWASNDVGEPLLPVRTTARPCTNTEGAIPRDPRECAYRAGVNMVMVALTGNYKSDQVHTPILLERLGRQ